MPSQDSLTKRLQKIAEEVEALGSAYKEAMTVRTKDGQIALAYVQPIEEVDG